MSGGKKKELETLSWNLEWAKAQSDSEGAGAPVPSEGSCLSFLLP